VNVPGDGFIRLKWAALAGAGLILIMLAAGAVGSAFNRTAAEPTSPSDPDTDAAGFSMPAEQTQLHPEEPSTPQPFEQVMMMEIVLPTLVATSPSSDADPEDIPPASLPEITPAPVEPTQPAVLAPSPTEAATPSPTQAPRLGSISGRVTLNGQPVGSTFKLVLENSQQSPLFNAWPAQDGAYAFTNLPAAVSGYTLVFERSEQDGFDIQDVISWGWLGPIFLQEGQDLTLADFELGYLSLEHINPEPYASLSTNTISPSNPLVFQWSAYPGGEQYWVDLAKGDQQQLVWQSPLVSGASAAFQGVLNDGTHIQPGEYWWGLGARRELGGYPFTIYSYLVKFVFEQ
jgi:hypothetical protein